MDTQDNHKKLQSGQSVSWQKDLNQKHSECEAGVLTTEQYFLLVYVVFKLQYPTTAGKL
jgi:hypothetical protein